MRTTVGVLRGGPSGEYDVSLNTGASILKSLNEEKYNPVDIFIAKDGQWHLNGLVKDPKEITKDVDILFNALHGEYGEDGKVQKILEDHGVRYTGSNSFGSAIGMNKYLSKKAFRSFGIKTPEYTVVRRDNMNDSLVKEIFTSFPQPSVIKPVSGGSSLGVSIAGTLDDLKCALEEAFKHSNTVLIEEFIDGKEATCGVIDSFRGEDVYALMPSEIIDKTGSDIWGYESKYSNDLHEIKCPGNFTKSEKDLIQILSKEAHKSLGLRHYSRSDFMVHPKRGIYILEVNTLPGLTETSLFPHALNSLGISLPEFIDHTISLALS
ncbi:MAG: D-alanine--D-alanine ligase [Candidatus Pacebacteria bacterium]|nr:D-alanine--D-alanine ligase [Candidatus Paceibacterota bacterium]